MTGAGARARVAACADLGAPAAFQRFVEHALQGATGLANGFENAREQVPTRLQRRPAGAMEHLVQRAEMGILLMAGVPPRRCTTAPVCHRAGVPPRRRDRSAATRAQRAPQQRQHFLPGRGRQQTTERFQQRDTGGRTRHERAPEQDSGLATAIFAPKRLMPGASSATRYTVELRPLLRGTAKDALSASRPRCLIARC